MTRNQNILAFSSAHYAGYVMCTVPNTYREEMDRQTSHPSCGFYAASYVLNCFNPDAAWTNMELLKLAVQYPLTNRAEGCLSEVGEVFHPHDFARFIHARANGSCSAACQLFHEQTIREGMPSFLFKLSMISKTKNTVSPGLASSGRTFRMHIGALLPDMQQRITPNCSPSTGEKTGYLI